MKRNESKQTSRNGQYANVCLSSVVFFSWWIYQSQNGIRYFQFWSCVTVARTWLLFRLFFLSFTLQQWALKLCVCVCGFIRDSSSFFFLVTFSIITAFSCHLDMCHFTGVCVVDCFYVSELKISLFSHSSPLRFVPSVEMSDQLNSNQFRFSKLISNQMYALLCAFIVHWIVNLFTTTTLLLTCFAFVQFINGLSVLARVPHYTFAARCNFELVVWSVLTEFQ